MTNFIFKNVNFISHRIPIYLTCLKHNKVVTIWPEVFLRGHGYDFWVKEASLVRLSKQILYEIHNFVRKLNGKCNPKN